MTTELIVPGAGLASTCSGTYNKDTRASGSHSEWDLYGHLRHQALSPEKRFREEPAQFVRSLGIAA